jgi:mono/diheme cytochrome c family protein
MRQGTKLARLGVVAIATVLMTGCGGEGEEAASGAAQADSQAMAPAPAAPAPAAGGTAADGAQLFAGPGNCFTCHGPGGAGTALAPNLTDAEWLNFPARPTLDEVVALIKTGVPQPKQHPAPMPPMGGAQLTDEQVQALAQYVLSLSGA